MNLRAAAIHALALHHPSIMAHTEDVQSYVVTGGQDILDILPDVGLEGDELTRATALLLSGGRDLIDDFPLVCAEQVSLEELWSSMDEGLGVLWSDGPTEAPEGWPGDDVGVQPYYAFVARAYIVRAIKAVYSEVMEPLAAEQLAYVTEGSSALYDKLVAAGVSDEDADRLAVLMDVEADVFPFDLGLSGILGGDPGGEVVAAVVRKALRMTLSTHRLAIDAGGDLDTPGADDEPSDNVLAPCAFIFSLNLKNPGSTTLAFNSAGFNNRGFHLKINSGKLQAIAGSSPTQQTIAQGAAVWAQDSPNWGAAIWSGSAWTLMQGGVVDPSTVSVRTADPRYGGSITWGQTGDDFDIGELVCIKGDVTPEQVNALKVKLVAGNYVAAAADINAFNSEIGYLVGPVGTDDPTDAVNGIQEHCAGRDVVVTSSPPLIDAFA